MKRFVSVLVVASCSFLSGQAVAAGDVEAGKQKSEACVACHGEAGKGGMPGFPVLAGQHADYLVQALKKYQSGERPNLMMAGMVAGLSEQDMLDLAAFFASQSGLQALQR